MEGAHRRTDSVGRGLRPLLLASLAIAGTSLPATAQAVLEDLRCRSATEAETYLTGVTISSYGFTSASGSTLVPDSSGQDVVSSQWPPAGTLLSEVSEVTLVVDTEVGLPDLTGLSVPEAESQIACYGWQLMAYDGESGSLRPMTAEEASGGIIEGHAPDFAAGSPIEIGGTVGVIIVLPPPDLGFLGAAIAGLLAGVLVTLLVTGRSRKNQE